MIGKIKLLRAANVSPHTGASRFVAAGLFFIIQSCVTSSVCYHLLPSGSDNSPSGAGCPISYSCHIDSVLLYSKFEAKRIKY